MSSTAKSPLRIEKLRVYFVQVLIEGLVPSCWISDNTTSAVTRWTTLNKASWFQWTDNLFSIVQEQQSFCGQVNHLPLTSLISQYLWAPYPLKLCRTVQWLQIAIDLKIVAMPGDYWLTLSWIEKLRVAWLPGIIFNGLGWPELVWTMSLGLSANASDVNSDVCSLQFTGIGKSEERMIVGQIVSWKPSGDGSSETIIDPGLVSLTASAGDFGENPSNPAALTSITCSCKICEALWSSFRDGEIDRIGYMAISYQKIRCLQRTLESRSSLLTDFLLWSTLDAETAVVTCSS